MLKSSMSSERGYKNTDLAKTLKKSGLQKQYWKNVDKMWIKSPYCSCLPVDGFCSPFYPQPAHIAVLPFPA
jgi:hypothetical protein